MDLWIRSQDRRILSKVSYLQEHFGNGKYGVYDETIPMGYYETEERAMQVLDEIQEILKPKTIIKFNEKEVYDEKENMVISTLLPYETFDIKQLSTYVYQMPKK